MPETTESLKQQLDALDARLQRDTSVLSVKDEIDAFYAKSKKLKYEDGVARCERHKADLLDGEGKIDEALKLNAKVKRYAKKNGLDVLYQSCRFFEFAYLLRRGDRKKCYSEVVKQLREAEQIGDEYWAANFQLFIGILSQQFGFDDEAISWFRKSLVISEKNRYFRIQSSLLMSLSELFLSKLQYDYAERYARKCIAVIGKLNDASAVLRSKIRLVTILIEKEELKETKKILADVWKENRNLTGPALGTYHLCAGKLFAKQKKYSDAVKEYDKAVAIFKEFKRDRLIANTHGIFAEMYLEEKNVAAALMSAQEMVKIAEEMHDGYHITQGYRLLYQSYKLSGDALNALEYLEKYNERLKNEEEQLLKTRLEFIELQKEYEMKQAEALAQRERSETLRIELEHKERELTEKTRHLIKQTDALSQFRDDLRAIIRRSPSDDPLIQQIKLRLKDVPDSQLNWEEFDKQFHSVHPVFLAKLLEKHPTLTKMEQKICSLLRLNMTSVDIAKLLYLSERNIENHRYRIRKKIALDSEVSLHEYLGRV